MIANIKNPNILEEKEPILQEAANKAIDELQKRENEKEGSKEKGTS